jgi:hypothetical protein
MVTSSLTVGRRKLKLPKIDLKNFGGEIKDFFNLLRLLKKIQDDKVMKEKYKVQYLIQGTIEGSRERFPANSGYYSKAIESLKHKCEMEELLIEYYVRQLLGLVIKIPKTAG